MPTDISPGAVIEVKKALKKKASQSRRQLSSAPLNRLPVQTRLAATGDQAALQVYMAGLRGGRIVH